MKRQRSSGFTLLEILVVALIVGVIATFAVLSIGSRSLDDRLDLEARRLNELFGLAAEEAVQQGTELGFRFTAEGYEFMAQNPADHGWVPFDDGLLRPRRLEEPLYLELAVEGRTVPPARPPTAEAESLTPQVLLLSSGEATPFALLVRAQAHTAYYRLEGDLLGQLKLERKDPAS